jgi:hypothetical protein
VPALTNPNLDDDSDTPLSVSLAHVEQLMGDPLDAPLPSGESLSARSESASTSKGGAAWLHARANDTDTSADGDASASPAPARRAHPARLEKRGSSINSSADDASDTESKSGSQKRVHRKKRHG